MAQNNKSWTILIIVFISILIPFTIIINVSHSLSYHVFLINRFDKNVTTNDFIVARQHGLKNLPDGRNIVKMIKGIPGDLITVKDRDVFINNKFIVRGNIKQDAFGKLAMIDSGIIPKDCYFLVGTSFSSYDSRYKDLGLVCKSQFVGRAYPLF